MEGSSKERPHAGRKFDDPLDRRISERAASQHATVAVRQLVSLGLSASAVRERVASGRLHRVYSGVVAVLAPRLLTRKGLTMAATLACRPGTLATHRAASALYELRLAQRAWIDVTTPGANGHRRAAIRVHDGTTLTAADVFVIDNIPCTTLARTLLDVAEDATRREVERALDVAEQRQILDMRAIDDVLARADGRRGAKLLRAVLAEHTIASTLTRNDLEEAFLAIARAAELPPTRRTPGSRSPTAAAPRPTSSGTTSTSSSRSTDATPTPSAKPSTQTANAMHGSCCSAGASYASPGNRSPSSPPTSPRHSAGY